MTSILTSDHVDALDANPSLNAGNPVASMADVGGSSIQSFTVTLEAEDVLNLGTTPFEIIPPQGPSKVIIPISVVCCWKAGPLDNEYTFTNPNSDHVDISPAGDPGSFYNEGLLVLRLVSSLTNSPEFVILWSGGLLQDLLPNMGDMGWVMKLDAGVNPTDGDATLLVVSHFIVVTLP
jgi:hypothetical protein